MFCKCIFWVRMCIISLMTEGKKFEGLKNNFPEEENKRESFRITYPKDDRPVLYLGGKSYEIIDISEKSIKLDTNEDDFFDFYLDATLYLMGDKNFRCNGIVKMIDDKKASLQFLKLFPVNMFEQSELLYHSIIKIDSNEYRIIDITEKEVIFECDQHVLYKLTYKAKIVFHDEESLTISGKIIRGGKSGIVLFLPKATIPFPRIVKEQQYLIGKYVRTNETDK